MNGKTLQAGLIAAYFIIACVYAYEKNWAKSAYFISAGAITISVIFME